MKKILLFTCSCFFASLLRSEQPHFQLRALAPGWVAIDWEHPNDGAEGILIERENPAHTWAMYELTNSYTDVGLTANTTYRYRVAAKYGTNLEWTPWVAVTTLPPAGSMGGLSVPVFTSAVAGTSGVVLQWTSTTAYGSYNVRWAKEGDNDGQNKIRGNTFNLTGLQPGQYHFIIQGCNWGALGSSCSKYSAPLFVTVSGAPPPPPPPPKTEGVIYGLNLNDDLLWYKHLGREDGTFRWAPGNPQTVGKGWAVKKIFSGGSGVLYTVADNGDLLWWRHTGWENGSFSWAFPQGKKVGQGWGAFKQLFAAEGGIIYGLKDNGDLVWYKHTGNQDGSFRWQYPDAKVVGKGWTAFTKIFYGGQGVLYALKPNGDLMWYKHTGYQDGSFRWQFADGKKVGNGWTGIEKIFSGGDGFIYAAMSNGDLLWYKHLGWLDGTFRWSANAGKKVGNGWYKFNLTQVFAE